MSGRVWVPVVSGPLAAYEPHGWEPGPVDTDPSNTLIALLEGAPRWMVWLGSGAATWSARW